MWIKVYDAYLRKKNSNKMLKSKNIPMKYGEMLHDFFSFERAAYFWFAEFIWTSQESEVST